MKKKDLITDFTEGNIARQLLTFAAPLFFSNLLQVIYNMVDMLIIGQKNGSTGLSAISVGGDVTNFMTFVAMGFSNAGQVIIAQYIGAKQEKKISQFIGTMTTFLLSCALVISVVVLCNSQSILNLMNVPDQASGQALNYVTICSVGMIFIYGYNTVSAILRGYGDSRHPFIFISTAAAVNVVLDVLFVMVFEWGAAGAALATVVSQALSFLMAVIFIFKNQKEMHLELSPQNFRIRKVYISTLAKLGIPMAIKSAAVQFSKLFVNSWINSFGVEVSAVSGVGNKLNTIANLFSNSFNTAGASMVGQNIGAKKYKRVSKIMQWTFISVVSIMCVLAGGLIAYPEKIFGLFTSDKSILPVGMEYLPVGIMVLFGSAFRAPMNTLLNGSGDYKINFLVAILDGMVNRIGFSLLLGIVLKMNYVGFWLGDAVASFTPFVIGWFYFIGGKWKERALDLSDS